MVLKIGKQGCPICNESIGEKLIRDFLTKSNINFNTQYKFTNCKDTRELPFDFYLSDYNTCIEYNGIQHYKPVEYFGGSASLLSQQNRDKIKSKYCNENNINLIIIKYTENLSKSLKEIIQCIYSN